MWSLRRAPAIRPARYFSKLRGTVAMKIQNDKMYADIRRSREDKAKKARVSSGDELSKEEGQRRNAQIMAAKNAGDLLHLVETEPFNPVNVCTAVNRLSKFKSHDVEIDDERWTNLRDVVVSRSLRFSAQGVANCLHGYAKMERKEMLEPGNFPRIELFQMAEKKAPKMNAQEVANTWWAIGTTQQVPPALLAAELDRAVERVAPEMNAQNVANTLWAYARLGYEPKTILIDQVPRHAPHMVGQNIRETLWSLAMLHQVELEVVQTLERTIKRTASRFKPQDVAGILWALCMMDYAVDKGTVDALAEAAVRTHKKMLKPEAANLVWVLDLIELPGFDGEMAMHLERVSNGMGPEEAIDLEPIDPDPRGTALRLKREHELEIGRNGRRKGMSSGDYVPTKRFLKEQW
ncbi:hypothetical protein M885DRAFT_612874 [Pelagophyceae sp. CCMP2097]|nr:hypothetical protein M885DRAFT_612874 [Pelagophyceae sp. CCMP2097]